MKIFLQVWKNILGSEIVVEGMKNILARYEIFVWKKFWRYEKKFEGMKKILGYEIIF